MGKITVDCLKFSVAELNFYCGVLWAAANIKKYFFLVAQPLRGRAGGIRRKIFFEGQKNKFLAGPLLRTFFAASLCIKHIFFHTYKANMHHSQDG